MNGSSFDQLNERALFVITLAESEARRLNHNYIGPEHVLLGLSRDRNSVAAQVLRELGVEFPKLRSAIEIVVGRGPRLVMGAIGMTPRARRVLELARDEARSLSSESVGTGHLLVGLIREGEAIAAGVLESMGVSLEKVHAEMVAAGGQGLEDPLPVDPEEMSIPEEPQQAGNSSDRFTERARKVLTLAQEEAQRFNHNYIGTEHLLLGLVREGEGVAAKVLSNLGIELTKVRSAVEFIIGRGERQVVGEIGLTPRAKKVIELAVDEARRLGHHYIGTEHLLLGLIREGEGIAAGILETLGVSLKRVRSEVLNVVAHSPSSAIPEEREEPSRPVPAPQSRWEYLSVQIVRSEGQPVVEQVLSRSDLSLSVTAGTPLDVALAHLGNDGWELMGIDPGTPASPEEPIGPTLYIFKREAGEQNRTA